MNAPGPTDVSTRVLAISLRICGGVDLLAIIPFLMPLAWIRAAHAWCGFGAFPDEPIAEYLARSTSLLWVMHGVLLIYLSRDVRRNADVIWFVAIVTVVAGLCLPTLSLRAGLPIWWTLAEGPVFTATGIWYLWWLRRLSRLRSKSPQA